MLIALIQLFLEDRLLLETRGALIVRKLCALLDPKSIYMHMAAILNDKTDLEFASIMVQTLNLILLTAPELNPLRATLKGSFQGNVAEADYEGFGVLFRCWCHNPVATISLCLLAQAYDLSAFLILKKFPEIDVTVGFLMQIDKLVQLLESPIFIHLRLQLIEIDSPLQEDLLKSLYGLLMLLPQSQAYKTLHDRLTTVSSLQMHVNGSGIRRSQTASKDPAAYIDLLTRFEDVQSRHSAFRAALLQQKSLLKMSAKSFYESTSS